MEKLLTAKKLLPCILKEGWYTIKKTDGSFTFHSTTNTINPLTEEKYKDLASRVDFDESEYLIAFEEFKIKLAEDRLNLLKLRQELDELAKEVKEQSDKKLREKILNCETPSELADLFSFSIVETAGHWSDLPEGRSRYAVIIEDRGDYEMMLMAKDLLHIDGEFGECKNRAGEHHHTFSRAYSLEDYQKNCKSHFSGDNYSYKSQEGEDEYVLECIKEANDLDDVRKILENFDELEEGYYDCNGSLMMLEETLNDLDFAGYHEDVYSYKFSFRFDNNFKFNTQEDEDEDEDD